MMQNDVLMLFPVHHDCFYDARFGPDVFRFLEELHHTVCLFISCEFFVLLPGPSSAASDVITVRLPFGTGTFSDVTAKQARHRRAKYLANS